MVESLDVLFKCWSVPLVFIFLYTPSIRYYPLNNLPRHGLGSAQPTGKAEKISLTNQVFLFKNIESFPHHLVLL